MTNNGAEGERGTQREVYYRCPHGKKALTPETKRNDHGDHHSLVPAPSAHHPQIRAAVRKVREELNMACRLFSCPRQKPRKSR